MINESGKKFERSFLSQQLADQVESCDRYELAPLFLKWFSGKRPVLEAGCGSGKWNAWLGNTGIPSGGVDWSEKLCARAQHEIPDSFFMSCDLRQLPFSSKMFGGLLALGSVEHIPDGPVAALCEFKRVLKEDAVAIITVPYGGRLRILTRRLQYPFYRLWRSYQLKKILQKNGAAAISLRQARVGTNSSWHPRFAVNESGAYFYEYEFNKVQMRSFLKEAGFWIKREFAAFHDEGIVNNFAPLAGHWDTGRGGVRFTILGKLLKKLLPVEISGHMLCYLVAKKSGS